MLKTYVTTDDGETFVCKNAMDFVKQLKDTSRASGEITLNQFMRETAARAQQSTGFKIEYRNVQGFLEGLLKAGLVKFSFENLLDPLICE